MQFGSRLIRTLFTASTLVLIPFSGSHAQGTAPKQASAGEAMMSAKNNSSVKGVVDFVPYAEGLKVTYKFEGLKPNTKHGFHVHEKGNCSSADAKSAGGHFAQIASHGGTSKDNPQEYAGDFPEIFANEKGVAEGYFVAPRLSLTGKYGVLDRAIIVHAAADNITAPSAPRIACGVISAKDKNSLALNIPSVSSPGSESATTSEGK